MFSVEPFRIAHHVLEFIVIYSQHYFAILILCMLSMNRVHVQLVKEIIKKGYN